MGAGASTMLATRLENDCKDKFGNVNVLNETPVGSHFGRFFVESSKQCSCLSDHVTVLLLLLLFLFLGSTTTTPPPGVYPSDDTGWA